LNGAPLDRPWFDEASLLAGGTWNVQVGAEPNEAWAASPYARPYSLSCGFTHLPRNPVVTVLSATGQDQPVLWRYTTAKPSAAWSRTDFDDSGWKEGASGFGTDDEGVTPRTAWNTDDIWMRRTVTLPASFHSVFLSAYHDQDIDIYLNGVPAAHVDGWTHFYDPLPIAPAAAATLKPGANVLAVHVHHGGDGRHFADAGLVQLEWPESEK
jgi:hypothetical protein